jgi:hypothetical protein
LEVAEAPPEWKAPIKELREKLAAMEIAACTPMRLEIRFSAGGARVVVAAADGRTAERPVRPDTLVPTALGLVMGIPAEASGTANASAPTTATATPTPTPTPTSTPTSTSAAPAPATSSFAPTPTSSAPPPPPLGLLASLSFGFRLTAPTSAAALDLEARVDLAVGRWLVLATVRSALVSCLGQQGLDCDAYTDVGGGVGIGRRFSLGPTALDVAFEPQIVAMKMEYDAGNDERTFSQATIPTLFLDVSARLVVPIAAHWGLALTLDGSVAPSILASPTHLELPAGVSSGTPLPFPAFTGGVRLGPVGALF